MPEARILADVLYKRDPMRVKYWHRVWGSQPLIGSGGHYANAHEVIDYRPEFMRLEDQLEEAANRISQLRQFQFLCRPALREGEVSQSVIPITIAHVDRDEETGEYQFPNPQRISEVCSLLAAQSGIPIKTLLAEQDAQLTRQQLPLQRDHEKPRQPSTAATGEKPSAPVGASPETPRVSSDQVLANPPLPSPHQRRRRIT
jgi:hypothetical protein